MDDKTFDELLKNDDISLILMDGGAGLTPQQMGRVKKRSAELSS